MKKNTKITVATTLAVVAVLVVAADPAAAETMTHMERMRFIYRLFFWGW